jgi:flavin reductase (DIM6/NTAB) family NADH-FMN oxidoreductase RutF
MVNDAFDAIVGSLDAPLVIVTAADGRERSGCLVGFSTQCSIEPCRWLVCLSPANHTARVARGTQTLVVHFLRADQLALAQLFGTATEDEIDKFTRCTWREGPGGAPVIAGCDWIAGEIRERVAFGDHDGYVLDVIEAGHEHAAAPQLGYQAARDIRPGHPA